MAIAFQHPNRAKFILIAYVVLIWFLLVLSGSLLGTFAQYPLVFYLIIGGPVALYVAGYLLSDAFRRFVHSLYLSLARCASRGVLGIIQIL